MVEYLIEVRRKEKFFDGFEVTPIIIEKLSKPSVKPVEPAYEAIKQDLTVIDEPK
jgi:hypothetical protein